MGAAVFAPTERRIHRELTRGETEREDFVGRGKYSFGSLHTSLGVLLYPLDEHLFQGDHVEDNPTPHPYGEVLTELLNCDVEPFAHALATLECTIEEEDAQSAPRAFMDAVRDLSTLPYFRLFLSDLRELNDLPVEEFVVGEARTAFEEYIFSDGKKDIAYMQEQVKAIRFIQERYAWFLTNAFQRTAFEKKKGQRKLPLAQQIYENLMDAFVSGVSLGQSLEVDAPQVNIQYAVLEIDREHHELVEKLYFDRVTDFVYAVYRVIKVVKK